MRVILLSGGKGKRLWPISTDEIPKQFINVWENSTNMLKKTYNCILEKIAKKNIYIATGKEYIENVKKEIPNFNNLIIEPEIIGTFGAIMNIVAHLSYLENCSKDEIIAVIPIDHETDNSFYDILFTAEKKILNDGFDICLIGINPTFPSTQYGYIIHNGNKVEYFKEKPKIEEAIELIGNNALWNSGIVIFRLGKILNIAKKYSHFTSYEEFKKNYCLLPHTSFDVEVLEHEKNIAVIKIEAHWNDLGTWEILSQKISTPDEFNTNIINFENKVIKNEGVKNAILVNGSNGIRLIKKSKNNIFYEQWGYFNILNNFDSLNICIKLSYLKILPGKNISYQYHKFTNKDWYILNGTGEIVIDGIKYWVKSGNTLIIPKRKSHSIKAINMLEIIEIKYGEKKNEEDDIICLEDNWDKIIKKHIKHRIKK